MYILPDHAVGGDPVGTECELRSRGGSFGPHQDPEMHIPPWYWFRTNEFEFLESVNEAGDTVYRRVLALGSQEGMLVTWATRSFTLNVVSGNGRIPVCNGYPATSFNQLMYTTFGEIAYKSSVPDDVVDALRQEALNTGLFRPAGRGNNLSCRTDMPLDESQLDALTGWLNSVAATIREHETPIREDTEQPVET